MVMWFIRVSGLRVDNRGPNSAPDCVLLEVVPYGQPALSVP